MPSRRMFAGTLAVAFAASLATFCAVVSRTPSNAPEGCRGALEHPHLPVANAVESELVRERVAVPLVPRPELVAVATASNGWTTNFGLEVAVAAFASDRIVSIPAGVTVKGTGTNPMTWLVTGDFTVGSVNR